MTAEEKIIELEKQLAEANEIIKIMAEFEKLILQIHKRVPRLSLKYLEKWRIK